MGNLLKDPRVIILDSLSSHKSATAADALRSTGAWFLSPNSPDLNSIQMAFSRLKILIRKAVARTCDELWKTVGQVCELVTAEECANFFRASGYECD